MKRAGLAPLDIMVTAVHHVLERMPDPEWTLACFSRLFLTVTGESPPASAEK